MKTTTTAANQIHFEILSPAVTQKKTVIYAVLGFAKKIFNKKDLLKTGAAIVGIGTVLLLSIYLFCIQLAEFGW